MRASTFFRGHVFPFSGWRDRIIVGRCGEELIAARRALADLAVDWAECRMGVGGARLRFEQARGRARCALAVLEAKGFVRGRVSEATWVRHFEADVQSDQARILDGAFPTRVGTERFDPVAVANAEYGHGGPWRDARPAICMHIPTLSPASFPTLAGSLPERAAMVA